MMQAIRRFLLRLHFALLSGALPKLHQLQRWQWLDKNKANALQLQRLEHLLVHSYYHVPYYREVLTSPGVVNDSGTVNLMYFPQIPLLDKDTIRAHFEDLKSDDLATREWYENTSGGSTGEPIRLIQDKYYSDWRDAVMMLYDLWTGYTIGSVKVKLWGSERDLFVGRETVKTQIRRWLKNQKWINAFLMTPEQMRSFVTKINVLKPVQILAYVESIYELSRFIERDGLRVYSPHSIVTSAGTLFNHVRKNIERVFKAPVFNRYGSRELGNVACECEYHTGLHVSAPTHYVEILMPDGSLAHPGEVGEIVVTSLTNYTMPLIRYRIGDMGMWGDSTCPCGRSWPLLKEVTGRITDVFVRRDGGIVSPEYLIHLIGVVLNSGWIRKYQVIQEDYDYIRVIIAPHGRVDNPQESYAQEMQQITEKVVLVMGQDCKVEYEYVDDIKPTASGKYRYTISKVVSDEEQMKIKFC